MTDSTFRAILVLKSWRFLCSTLSVLAINAVALGAQRPSGAPVTPHEAVVSALRRLDAQEEAPSPGAAAEAASRFAADPLFAGLAGTSFERGSDAAEAIEAVRRVTLVSTDTRVKNQGERGWCTAFATLAVLENLALRSLGRAYNLSEIHLWSHYAQPQMFAAVRAALRTRTALETAWGYRYARPDDIDARGIALATSARELTTRAQVLASLDAGHPVVMGTVITSAWHTPYYGAVSTGGAELGGHAIALVGYAVDPGVAGGGYFIIKNSWGPSWGDRGYGYVPFSQCTAHWCAFIAIDGVDVRPY